MLANEVEWLKPPQYVGFRTMERWVVIPVIARRRASLWTLVQQIHTRRRLQRSACRPCRRFGERRRS